MLCVSDMLYLIYKYIHIYFIQSIGAPKLLFQQNQTVWINISEQIILNCTVSSSPDPVYSWYIPNSCSSCPRNANNNILSFTTNFTDLGSHLFRCNATNSYGSITISYTVHVLCKNYTCMHNAYTYIYACVCAFTLLYTYMINYMYSIYIIIIAKPVMFYSAKTIVKRQE